MAAKDNKDKPAPNDKGDAKDQKDSKDQKDQKENVEGKKDELCNVFMEIAIGGKHALTVAWNGHETGSTALRTNVYGADEPDKVAGRVEFKLYDKVAPKVRTPTSLDQASIETCFTDSYRPPPISAASAPASSQTARRSLPRSTTPARPSIGSFLDSWFRAATLSVGTGRAGCRSTVVKYVCWKRDRSGRKRIDEQFSDEKFTKNHDSTCLPHHQSWRRTGGIQLAC